MVSSEEDINDSEKNLDVLMRRWTIFILKDMFIGAKRFNDFLEMNPRMSGKVLSDQLKNLERYGYIEKVVVSKTPLRAEYHLTEKGQGLNRMLYELVVFARDYLDTDQECEMFQEVNLKRTFRI